jgi:SAM-dependent methyltransferase
MESLLMNDQDYDELLNIETGERQVRFYKSFHYHPYEPTPYSVLEILFNEYELNKDDHLVDFGCGKGRLNFYVHNRFQAKVIGVEMNELFFKNAIDNLDSYKKKRKVKEEDITFQCCLAEEYPIGEAENKFYFFNPFSVEIFRKVVQQILQSKEKVNRGIDLILYYSSYEYLYFLEIETLFQLKQEVMIPNLSKRNPYERFLIYHLS